MRGKEPYAEYLAAVREQVCGHCPERAPDGPPLGPRCRRCGVELQLGRLVESIHDAGEVLAAFGPAPDRRVVCAYCTCLDGGMCPCPAGSLTEWVVRAIRAVDERREQRDHLRRLLARLPRKERPPVAAMIRAYEAATGTCVCCD